MIDLYFDKNNYDSLWHLLWSNPFSDLNKEKLDFAFKEIESMKKFSVLNIVSLNDHSWFSGYRELFKTKLENYIFEEGFTEENPFKITFDGKNLNP